MCTQVTLMLWRTPLAKPQKLIAVFVHEMSHATACWLSCGKVMAIEVYDNEGGVTKFTGGCQCLIIPAGYIGCAFWGALFVVLSAHRISATCVAGLFAAGLVATLFFRPNKVLE